MGTSRFDDALSDVSKVFEEPSAILRAGDLNAEQKIKLLRQWETDLRLLLVASEENMTGPGQGLTAERLRQVQKGLHSLGAIEEEPSPAATKSGG